MEERNRMGIGTRKFLRKKNKQFVVFGIGRFGRSVAKALADSGCEVMVIDNNPDRISEYCRICNPCSGSRCHRYRRTGKYGN